MTTKLRGVALLRDPHLNKSTTFTEAEREALGLVGLVPEGLDSEEVQLQRVLQQLAYKPNDNGSTNADGRKVFGVELHDRNRLSVSGYQSRLLRRGGVSIPTVIVDKSRRDR